MTKARPVWLGLVVKIGRGARIRTGGLLLPKLRLSHHRPSSTRACNHDVSLSLA